MPDAAATVRIVAGLVFIGGGLAKFVFNGWEVDAFESLGCRWPGPS